MNREVVEARFSAAARALAELPPPLRTEIAFVGRSNVGKSSLLNALMKRRNLARTSGTPGCTRAITFFEARTRSGSWVTLVDLPGYGYAARSKTERKTWGELIDGYLLTRPVLRAVALLVDVRRGLADEEHELLRLLQTPAPNRPALHIVLVGTKLDKLQRAERAGAVLKLRAEGQAAQAVVGFSTELPDTAADVWNKLYGPLA